jgi:hypothetical protein
MSDLDFMYGKVGLPSGNLLGEGTRSEVRLDRTGGVVTGEAHGKYYEAGSRGKIFYACNVAAQAISVALATTYTGCCLSNPAGSSVDLSVLKASFGHSAAPATFPTIVLIGGFTAAGVVTHTTPLLPASTRLSGAIGQGKADSAATIPTPLYLYPLQSSPATGTLPVSGGQATFDIDGLFVIPPGGFVAIGALTVATGFSGFTWEEVPNS